ncbi:MAG: phosphonate ABC transporter, permease protein PhnE [Armatimonadetes bacterium]|nr:phosphonate ABC transporter, permease protein PhnE [Armatimonadota bacterium]
MRAESTSMKRALIAGALSAIIPGLGQIYAGSMRRGFTLLLGLPVQAAIFYGMNLRWLALWMALVWVWNIFDAVIIARGRVTSAFVPILLILTLNVVAAGKVTDIHVPQLQPEQRSVIGQIIGGMAKPDFLIPKSTTQIATGIYVVAEENQSDPHRPAVATKPDEPVLTLDPAIAHKGDRIHVTGSGFAPNASGSLVLLGGAEIDIGRITTDGKGNFSKSFINERDIVGDYYVQARVTVPHRGYALSDTLRDAAPKMLETIYLALLGTAISVLFAIPLSFFGARNLMLHSLLLKALYGITRAVFTILRSVEVLIFAVIAVAAVGIGPFAGVLALAIHGIGAVGKLYSEAIESIEHGPIEAVRATGANEFQVVLFGVIPQVVPQFIAFTLYRWDINVRMATVIGLVGGGGIGYQLIQYMNLLQWRQAATAIWMIAGVVMEMDYTSAIIREKVI